jgi:hypothetical protein
VWAGALDGVAVRPPFGNSDGELLLLLAEGTANSSGLSKVVGANVVAVLGRLDGRVAGTVGGKAD